MRESLRSVVMEADDCQVPATVDPRSVIELFEWCDKLEQALERIAAPKRPDGTWNLSRDSCREIACVALGAWNAKPDARLYTSYDSDPQEYL